MPAHVMRTTPHMRQPRTPRPPTHPQMKKMQSPTTMRFEQTTTWQCSIPPRILTNLKDRQELPRERKNRKCETANGEITANAKLRSTEWKNYRETVRCNDTSQTQLTLRKCETTEWRNYRKTEFFNDVKCKLRFLCKITAQNQPICNV